ncbi:amino acid aminotransferase [Acinetobacter sp. MD2]|uniref:amino acid aminotransferase n=1 Tax=Acinetobacter sp. MD2 TaxID=2600066 RepID=UPI002D1F49C0|nr:amino acid aminotransferase [Acinetobacter sp. MD2]MEB3767666.1 aspartate/tyrosine/aromatic aminotransferase [Acinetobacter sp. MD2]
MFDQVPHYAGDPILSLVEQFKVDPRPNKVNLSVGMYYNDEGVVPQLAAIRAAQQLQADIDANAKLYLPMEGLPDYRNAVQELLFGEQHSAIKDQRIATIQTLGGAGAISIGANFLKSFFPDSGVWLSQPTWDNHAAIFNGVGFKTHYYPYYDAVTGQIDFDGMCETLSVLSAHSIVLLHPCCHNPTGMDLVPEQWDRVIEIIQQRGLIPFLDIAYQGLGDGIEQDAYLIRALANTQVQFMLSNSFSKIFSLYGERVGGLSVVCQHQEEATRVLGQLKAVIRRHYTCPPTTGAALVNVVLNKLELKQLWLTEVETMRQRIVLMRQQLKALLSEKLPEQNFDYLTEQQGMFSYTGLSVEQVNCLREEYAVYLIKSGRICISGLNSSNVEYVAQAIAEVIQSEVALG